MVENPRGVPESEQKFEPEQAIFELIDSVHDVDGLITLLQDNEFRQLLASFTGSVYKDRLTHKIIELTPVSGVLKPEYSLEEKREAYEESQSVADLEALRQFMSRPAARALFTQLNFETRQYWNNWLTEKMLTLLPEGDAGIHEVQAVWEKEYRLEPLGAEIIAAEVERFQQVQSVGELNELWVSILAHPAVQQQMQNPEKSGHLIAELRAVSERVVHRLQASIQEEKQIQTKKAEQKETTPKQRETQRQQGEPRKRQVEIVASSEHKRLSKEEKDRFFEEVTRDQSVQKNRKLNIRGQGTRTDRYSCNDIWSEEKPVKLWIQGFDTLWNEPERERPRKLDGKMAEMIVPYLRLQDEGKDVYVDIRAVKRHKHDGKETDLLEVDVIKVRYSEDQLDGGGSEENPVIEEPAAPPAPVETTEDQLSREQEERKRRYIEAGTEADEGLPPLDNDNDRLVQGIARELGKQYGGMVSSHDQLKKINELVQSVNEAQSGQEKKLALDNLYNYISFSDDTLQIPDDPDDD